MESTTKANEPNTAQPEQNPVEQSTIQPIKQKNNLLVLGGIVLVCFLVFGVGGFFLGRQYSGSPITSVTNQTPTPTDAPQVVSPTLQASPQPTSTVMSGWNNYTIAPLNLSFQYPPDLEIAKDIQNSTALAADDEYWVAVGGSDVLYLQFFLYKSTKSPSDWWNTDGKTKFEKLANGIENAMNPKPTINLTYSTNPTTFVGKQALEVTVSSNYGSPHTPEQRFITIFQQNGYIVMVSYYDQGTTKPSIDTSNQILSTFKFTN